MSFKIFASGSGGFHYSRANCMDGSEFDAIKIISILGSMEHSALGVAGAGLDHVTPGITDLYISMANMTFLKTLKISIDCLAMECGPGEGHINLIAKETHALWADEVEFKQYFFSPGHNPGKEFVETIVSSLEKTDMDNFGVLRMLSIVLGTYLNHIQRKNIKRVMITIQLTN